MVRAEIEATLNRATGALFMAALHEKCADLSARGKVVVMERATAIFLELKAAPTTPLPSLSDYPKTPPLPPLLKKP